jgi:hypothetical protein
MKQARKRAPGAGRPAGELGAKRATLTFRLPPSMRVALTAAAKKKGRRSLGEEIVIRLDASLRRNRKEDSWPLHIRALSKVVAQIAFALEQRTKLPWIEDRYTQEQLSKAIDLFLWTYSRGEAATPPAVNAEAARNPTDTMLVDRLGEIVAGGVIAWLKSIPEPLPQEALAKIKYSDEEIEYPEAWWSFWNTERNLQPGRQK